jgi:hypothetical protein
MIGTEDLTREIFGTSQQNAPPDRPQIKTPFSDGKKGETHRAFQ